ncbi:MAG: N-acetyl-alpha-D-glucosaminyl L-malate synthase BshA [Bacteroidia bacterium]
MNIGIVCYPTYGGSGVVATELGKGLAARGHKVHFISYTQPARLDIFMENIYYHEVAMVHYPLFEHSPYLLALTSKLVDVVKYEKLELLHVHYAIPHATAANLAQQILASQGIRVAIVTTLHGTDVTLVGKDPTYEPVVSYAINQSDSVTAVSDFLKADTYRHFHVHREIEVIPNFIDLTRFSHKAKSHFKMAIAPNGERIITHVSNFRKVKRIDQVINTFKGIRDSLPAKLILVGDGPERQKAEQMCRELQLCDDVRFLGKQEAIEEILSVSDLFLMPSETESFGLAALEAMACQVPVVSSNAGGLPEVNIHGKTGFLAAVEDTEAMIRFSLEILSDDNRLNAFRAEALAQAKRFDMAKILPLYEQLYERTIAEELA